MRYHVVSLAAVLFALAAGVVLGAGWLSDTDAPIVNSSRSDGSAITQFESSFAARTAPQILKDSLNGQDVAVLALPGADEQQIDSLVTNLRTAGGTVTAQGQVSSKLLDPANRQFVEGVAQESAPADVLADQQGSYAKVGAAIARTFIDTSGAETDETADSISTAFAEAGLLKWASTPAKYADLVLIVAGDQANADAAPVLRELTARFAADGRGVVVAGPSESSTSKGIIGAMREDGVGDRVSTVDVTDAAAGRVVATLALASTRQGRAGSWGTSRSADGAVPGSA